MLVHLRQPNRWTCLATSLAMVCRVTVQDILTIAAVDASEILWPDLPEPHRRRGILVNEMVRVAFLLGKHLVPVIPNWPARPTEEATPKMISLPDDWVEMMFNSHDGIIIGEAKSGAYHAVAWDCSRRAILDPSGVSYGLKDFKIESFWASV